MVGIQNKVEIRPAHQADISAILDMIDEEIFDEKSAGGTLLRVSPIDLWKRIYRGNAFGAYDGERIVGIATLVEYDNVAEMATVFIRPEYRSEGISTLLKDKVVERAVERGHSSLYSYTNDAALPKFQKWGFEGTTSTPEKLANYCLSCPKYERNCNEIPVVLQI